MYKVKFSECNVATPAAAGEPDANGMTWYTYNLYLNFNMPAGIGTGTIQQLRQTKIECKVGYIMCKCVYVFLYIFSDLRFYR